METINMANGKRGCFEYGKSSMITIGDGAISFCNLISEEIYVNGEAMVYKDFLARYLEDSIILEKYTDVEEKSLNGQICYVHVNLDIVERFTIRRTNGTEFLFTKVLEEWKMECRSKSGETICTGSTKMNPGFFQSTCKENTLISVKMIGKQEVSLA